MLVSAVVDVVVVAADSVAASAVAVPDTVVGLDSWDVGSVLIAESGGLEAGGCSFSVDPFSLGMSALSADISPFLAGCVKLQT